MLNRLRTVFARYLSAYVRRGRDNVLDNYDVPRKPANLRFPVARPRGFEDGVRRRSTPTGTGSGTHDPTELRSIAIPPPAA